MDVQRDARRAHHAASPDRPVVWERTTCAANPDARRVQVARVDGVVSRLPNQRGDGLKSHGQGNNARKLSRGQRADLKTRVNSYGPDQVLAAAVRISQEQFGTVRDLKIVVQRWYGVTYRSATSYQTLLHEGGLSQHQTEGPYRSQPDAQTIADVEATLEKK